MNKPMRSVSTIESALKEKGLRVTGQRRVIARLLAQTKDHPDIEELHRRALKLDATIALSTVYRTLKTLSDEGIIEMHAFGNGRARFEPRSEKHHDHIINVATGDVVEFHSEEIERLQAEIAQKMGYRLIAHRLELFCEKIES